MNATFFAERLNFIITNLQSSGIFELWNMHSSWLMIVKGKGFARRTKDTVAAYGGERAEEEKLSIVPLLMNVALAGWSASFCAVVGESIARRLRRLGRPPKRTVLRPTSIIVELPEAGIPVVVPKAATIVDMTVLRVTD